MYSKKVAVVGGGFAGISLITGVVRTAIDTQQTDISITLFEPNDIGPGIAYDTNAPDTFKLNHELDFMGSVNPYLAQTDNKDFYKWVQGNLDKLEQRYAAYDLINPKEYVPRNLFGKYLQTRYEELKNYAAKHDIPIYENRSKVDDVRKADGQFVVEAAGISDSYDVVVLTTGNYFGQVDLTLKQTGKYFRPYDYKAYVSATIPDRSIMLVAGSALSAYDAAFYALESGKYRKVVMASRRGMLRKVRGNTMPYTRQYVTIENLESMAGGAGKPFRLAHLLRAIKAELRHAYGQNITWKESYTTAEILQILQDDIAAVQNNRTLIWRSIHSSLSDNERHEIYARLAETDKQQFIREYSSLYQLFSAPMPLPNANKLIRYIAEGKLELVNGIQQISYNQERAGFEIWCAHTPGGTPLPLGKKPETLKLNKTVHPTVADVCVDAMGLGRDIHHIPLYRRMMESGLAVSNALGGIQVDIDSRYIINAAGNAVKGLYAFGQMTCGETVLPHNSVHLSRISTAIGANIVDYLGSATPTKHNVTRWLGTAQTAQSSKTSL